MPQYPSSWLSTPPNPLPQAQPPSYPCPWAQTPITHPWAQTPPLTPSPGSGPPQLSPPHPSLPRSSLDMPQRSPPLYAQGPYLAPEQWAEIPAPDFHASPQRGLPSSDYSESWVGFGACLSFPRSRGWQWGDGEQSWDPLLSPGLPDSQQMPQTNPPDQVMSSVDRDVVSPIPHPPHLRGGHPSPPCWHPPGPILLPQEVLNHVLSDLELFVVRLKTALGLVSTTNTKKKKKKNKKGGAGGLCP